MLGQLCLVLLFGKLRSLNVLPIALVCLHQCHRRQERQQRRQRLLVLLLLRKLILNLILKKEINQLVGPMVLCFLTALAVVAVVVVVVAALLLSSGSFNVIIFFYSGKRTYILYMQHLLLSLLELNISLLKNLIIDELINNIFVIRLEGGIFCPFCIVNF